MSLKTFILAELYKGGIAYGLEFVRRFHAAGIVSWEGVTHGSVYRALARLAEEGLVARYGAGKRLRNRKFYAITKRGRRAFEDTLSGELAEPRTYRNPLNIAVHCLRALPAPRAVALLELRRRRLADHEGLAAEVAREAGGGGRRSTYERLAAERILLKARAEIFFAASLAEYLRGSG
ncbi:MAG: PadR family transcriptional regulator [Spirochaetaceae bacterium]|nr:PadR family transcriptional regulator [Spirochaetaceae bacterium]